MERNKELQEALSTLDTVADEMGKEIIRIAYNNEDFVCSTCLHTAAKLYSLFRKVAREEDVQRIYDKFRQITGRDIDE